LLREEVRFVHDVEFRRGVRTSNEWKPFCPKCHLPIALRERQAGRPFCNDRTCNWFSAVECLLVTTEAMSLPVRP
jgi:hypothetical protein